MFRRVLKGSNAFTLGDKMKELVFFHPRKWAVWQQFQSGGREAAGCTDVPSFSPSLTDSCRTRFLHQRPHRTGAAAAGTGSRLASSSAHPHQGGPTAPSAPAATPATSLHQRLGKKAAQDGVDSESRCFSNAKTLRP